MFLKVTRSKNRFYLQLVQSYREGAKTRHKVIANLGSHDQLEGNPLLLSLGKRLLQVAGEPQPESSDPAPIEMEELGRYCYGHLVYRKLWDKLGLSALVKQILQGRKLRFDVEQTLYLLAIDRLLKPQSKRGTYLRQDRYFDLKPIALHHSYRLLEVLAQSKQGIEDYLFHKQANLFNLKVDVVFYDITTFHFESVRPDELKDFGFSKAGKFNEVQVLLGLLVDATGRPIGFDLYPGNTFEGSTLVDALNKLKDRFEIGKVVFVADKGLNSAQNLHLIREAGYEYIVACPAKRKGKKVQQNIFDPQDYQLTAEPKTGEITFKYKWINNEVSFYKKTETAKEKITFEDRILVSWTAKRAQRDRISRERHIQKAQKMVEQQTTTSSKKGAARFLKTTGKEKVVGINEEKILEDQKWDGFHTIQTNADFTHIQVLEAYNTLWTIENAFRVLKSTMDTRPIFHWTPSRITGHFVLCFIAFILERNLEIKLKNNQIDLSPDRIKEVLNSLELSHVKINDQQYWLKAKAQKPAAKILKAMRIKQPQNLTPLNQIDIG